MRLFSPLAIYFLILFYALNCNAAENYVPIALPYDVGVKLPRNWVVLSGNQRVTLDSTVQSRLESVGMFDASSDLNFAANLYDETKKTQAVFNIRYYPDMELTQIDARAASAQDIKELDDELKSNIAQAGQILGYSILKWLGTSRKTLNGTVSFITEYERSPIKNNGNFRVRLVRVFNGKASFTITVSYRVNQEFLLRPICDYIIDSIKG